MTVVTPGDVSPVPTALIERYAYLSPIIARKVYRTAPEALDQAELVSLANLGLCLAANRWAAYCAEREFDPFRMDYFYAFAQRRMRGAIMDELRSQDWVRRSVRTAARKLAALPTVAGSTDADLAERSGLSIGVVRSVQLELSQRPVSLDAGVDVAEISDVEQRALEREVAGCVADEIELLSDSVQVVLALRYFSGLEIHEIAMVTGLPESAVSEMHCMAVLVVHRTLVTQFADEEAC